MKRIVLLLLVLGLAAAGAGDPLLGQGEISPSEAIQQQLQFVYSLVIPLMLTMVALAATAYVIGQLFGAETRARANVWAQGMLTAAGVSALVIAMLTFIVPYFLEGEAPDVDITTLIDQIKRLGEMALIWLTLLLLVLSGAVYTIGQLFDAQTRSRATVWATGLLSGAVVSTVIYILIYHILTQFQGTFFSGTPLELYSGVIINITFFASFLILITYLASKVFKVPEWEAYLNIELSNLMASFLIVLFVVGFFWVASTVAAAQIGESSPPKAAITYMKGVVADSVLRGVFDVYQIQACTSMLSTISRRIGEFVLTQTYKVFPGLDTFVSISNVLAFGLISVYGSLSAQIALLYLIDGTMVGFFLPAGLVLRFFPPTRDAGAFLISVAFGFQIIFPSTYLLHKSIFEEVFQLQPGKTLYHTPTVLIASICGPFKFGVYGVLFNTSVNPIYGIPFPGLTMVGNMLARLFSESLLNFISMPEFVIVMEQISSLSLLALFMPALSMVVTIAFINAMTKFIVAKV